MVANSPQLISSSPTPDTPKSHQGSVKQGAVKQGSLHQPISHQLVTSISAISSIGIHKDHGEDTFQVMNTIMPETLEDVVYFDDALKQNFQYFSITRSFTPNRMGVTPGEISQLSFREFIEHRTHPDMTTEEWRKFWLEFMQETDNKVNHWIESIKSRGNIGCSFLGLILDGNHYSALNVGSNVLYLYRDGICRQSLQIQAFAADDEDERPARYFGTHAGWRVWRLQNCTHGELKDGDIFILGTNSFYRFGGDLIDLGFQLQQILPLDPSSSPLSLRNRSTLPSGSVTSNRGNPFQDEGKTSLFMPGSAPSPKLSQPTQVLLPHSGQRGKDDLTSLRYASNLSHSLKTIDDRVERPKGQDLASVLREIHQKTRIAHPASDLTLMAIQVSLKKCPAIPQAIRVPPPLSEEKAAKMSRERKQENGQASQTLSLTTEPSTLESFSASGEEAFQAMWTLGIKKAMLAFLVGMVLGIFLILLWSLAFL